MVHFYYSWWAVRRVPPRINQNNNYYFGKNDWPYQNAFVELPFECELFGRRHRPLVRGLGLVLLLLKMIYLKHFIIKITVDNNKISQILKHGDHHLTPIEFEHFIKDTTIVKKSIGKAWYTIDYSGEGSSETVHSNCLISLLSCCLSLFSSHLFLFSNLHSLLVRSAMPQFIPMCSTDSTFIYSSLPVKVTR